MAKCDFEKIWCLSCLDKERLETSARVFKKYDLDVCYFYNPINPLIKRCNKESFETEFYVRMANHTTYDNVFNSVASCFVGHYNIIKISYELGLNSILIFEDDIDFFESIELQKVFDQIPDDWDALNFYADAEVRKLDKFCDEKDFWKKVEKWQDFRTCTMYAMRRSYMKQYLDYYETHPPTPSDLFWRNISVEKNNVYINNYNIIKPTLHYSTIIKQNWNS